MKIEFDNNKARWVEGEKKGRWQKIKSDSNGQFIRKGAEIVYIEAPKKEGGDDIVHEDDAMFFIDAYWKTKPFWDKRHGETAPRDYYFYRNNLAQYSKNFYLKNKNT